MKQMSAVRSIHPPIEASLPLRLTADTYLTDESDLFRCVSADLSGDPDGTALLEDCRSLELVVLPIAELERARLRVVRGG